jgi:hypothetical protein
LLWHEDQFSAPDGADVVARTEVCLQAFVIGVHTGLQFHPEVDREIVSHWVADARDQGTVDDATAGALLAGFDSGDRDREGRTRRLFAGFVARSGVGA